MDAVEKIQVGGRSLGQWRDIALCDDAFDKMVPSDFRQILGHLMRIEETRLTAEQAKDAEIAERDALLREASVRLRDGPFEDIAERADTILNRERDNATG